MATPSHAEERFYTVAAEKGSAWGTAVAVGAADGILVEADGGPKLDQDYVQHEEMDAAMPIGGDLLDIKPVEFSPAGVMRYEPGKLGMLIACLMGTAGVPTTTDTGVYEHTFQLADVMDGLFATFVSEYPNKIREVASAKPVGLSLSIAGGLLKWSIKLRGNTLIDSSAVNGATQVDAVTYPDKGHRVRLADLALKINAQSGGDVASEDALANLVGLNIDIDRPMDSLHTAGSGQIVEPKEEGVPVVRVKLAWARTGAVDQALQAAFAAGTAYKMLGTFTGAIISGAHAYFLKFYFPRLVLTPAPEWKKSKVITAEAAFLAEQASANPTGMSYARPYIEIQNTQATDYLA